MSKSKIADHVVFKNLVGYWYEARLLHDPADPVKSGWDLVYDETGEPVEASTAENAKLAAIAAAEHGGLDQEHIVIVRMQYAYMRLKPLSEKKKV